MDIEKIEEFLVGYCGYKSIEEAKKNYTPLNLYPLIGEIKVKDDKNKLLMDKQC